MSSLPTHLYDASVASLSEAIRQRVVSSVEVVTSHLDRLDQIEDSHHSMISRRDRAHVLGEARQRDDDLARDHWQGPWHGIPHAVKDLADCRGLPTSFGFFDRPALAAQDELFVGHLRTMGAVFVGKTNTPEFGLGSHTYNGLGPPTSNAWNLGVSAGGSSGGAAVAVALGAVPTADGSDFMGSLRNPPGWNGVLGLRPTPGMVPERGEDPATPGCGVAGPIARTSTDLWWLLCAMAGSKNTTWDDISPPDSPPRIGWLADLDGYLTYEAGVTSACLNALERWSSAGASVDLVSIPTAEEFLLERDLWPTWLTTRFFEAGSQLQEVRRQFPEQVMKPEARWEIDGFEHLSASAIGDAARRRKVLRALLLQLLQSFDVLALPTAQVWPFPVEQQWPRVIGEDSMTSYHRWMEVTTLATLASLPVVAVPAKADVSGQCIGLQLIGRPNAERALCKIAAWGEQSASFVVTAPSELGS